MFNKKYKYVKYKVLHGYYDGMTKLCLTMEKAHVVICGIFNCAHKPLSKRSFRFWSNLFLYFWDKDFQVIRQYYAR